MGNKRGTQRTAMPVFLAPDPWRRSRKQGEPSLFWTRYARDVVHDNALFFLSLRLGFGILGG